MTEVAINTVKKSSLGRRVHNWSRRTNMERRIAMMFLALGALSVLMTYLVLTDVWQT